MYDIENHVIPKFELILTDKTAEQEIVGITSADYERLEKDITALDDGRRKVGHNPSKTTRLRTIRQARNCPR
jgi:low affinity Fe/Cu permease